MLDTIKQFLKEHEIDEKAGFIIAVRGGRFNHFTPRIQVLESTHTRLALQLQPARQRVEHGRTIRKTVL